MDADSSYGGSDTAQDNSSFMDSTTTMTTTSPHSDTVDVTTATHNMPTPPPQDEPNAFYHKNEITLPVNYDETDFQDDKSTTADKQPHYLSTANLNINETLENHSNLEEMSKNYKSTSHLNVSESPKVRRKSDAGGIDNPAFNHKGDDCKPEVKSTFGNNRPYSGDLNSSNILGLTSPNKNDEPLTEAVNLELINLKPGTGKDVTGPYENGSNGTTGIPVKKETDAEMGNPYDEYFVPVNEHRKYMRGEKLYVTMDKRNKKKRNKCLCWGICLCIVAAAVIIGILAAVGVIGNQGAHPVQEVSARHFDGSNNAEATKESDNVKAAGGIFGLPPDLTRSSTPGLPVTTISNLLPSTDTSMIEVPRALESEIIIDNLEFTEALKDKNSTEYKELAKSLEDQIKNSLFSFNELYNGAANIEVKVMDFEAGSVVVKYRITWNFNEGLHNTKDPLDAEMLKRKMRNALGSSGNMGTYHVKEVKAQKILDQCQFENHQCEHTCSFDYELADFVCSCPAGQYLAEDKKKCLEQPSIIEPDLHFEHAEKTEPAAEPEPTTTQHPDQHLHHEPTPEPSSEPEPTSELVSEGKPHVQIHTYEEVAPQPEPTAEPEPEPTSEPEAEPTQKPEDVSHENYVHFHPVDEVPVAEPTSEPSAEPTAEPNAEPTAEPNAEPTAEPNAEPTAEPSAEPTTQSSHMDSTSEKEHVHIIAPLHETSTEPSAEPTAEPTAEPVPEPTTILPELDLKDIPTVEPLPEPSAEPTADKHEIIEAEVPPTPEPSAEPTAEPSAEPTTTETNSQPELIIGISSSSTTTSTEPSAEPTAEPTAEPSPEPTTQKISESSSESVIEHVTLLSVAEHPTEPSAEPTPEPISDDTLKVSHEPTPEPSTEPTTSLPSMSSSPSSTEEPELRQNHFAGEIFAEPETTTKLWNKSSTETIIKGSVASSEVTTNTPKSEDVSSSEEINLMSVTVNSEQSEVHTTQSSSQPESITVSIVINDEAMAMHPENVTISNATSSEEPKIYEVTTPSSSEMTKIFSELHKVMDSSTEIIMPVTTNMAAAESNESTSAMDNMSPFLPELDNDTFVNKLHLGEHYLDHTQRESHDDEIYVTPAAPRLDDDEMNTTNPYDLNPKDAGLKVIPLEGGENSTNEIQLNSTAINETYSENTSEAMITTTPKVILEETNATTEKQQELVIPVVVVSEVSATTTKEPEKVVTTLPPEIINNVHSNSFFDKMHHEHEDKNETIGNVTTTPQNISSSIGDTSTEDLLAVETTTTGANKLPSDSENRGVVGIRAKEVIPTTIHADIVDTVTETVIFKSANESSVIMVIPHEKAMNETETTNSTITELKQETTMAPPQVNTSRQYEVKETVADITTTERIFVTAKSTTESAKNLTNDLLRNINYDELAVEPLNPEEENQLESESNENANDITEERSVLDKFHHGFNEIHDDIGTTTTKTDETDTEPIKKDKFNFEKKAKLEKVPRTDEEMMSTSLPSDKDQHPFSDIRPVTEGYSILPSFSRCLSDQFHCVNGTSMKDGNYCISQNDRCDSVDDCTDGSDEIDCEKEGCPNNFQCASGQCLKRHLVCDGIQNCNDGSDESSCENWTCKPDEISCGEGRRCIPKAWKCDGRNQCSNGIDEHGCPSMECGNSTFQCHEQGTCIPSTWRCDGKTDCVNSEDERSCVCTSSEYKCAIGGGCVKLDQRCDGSSDCADGSDEWNCLRLKEDDTNKYLQVGSGNETWHPVCSDNWNQTYSDLICQELGFSESSLTETIAKPIGNFSGFYRIKTNPQSGSPILSQLEKTDSCDFLTSVTCQEFTCGVHSSVDAQSARIIGGNIAADTQWPSLTLLYNKKKNFQCTATLLAPLWAVASHSCVFYSTSQANRPSDWILYAGSSHFFGNTDNSTTQTRNINKIVSHPQAKFSHFEFINDLVLLKLSSPLTLTRNVSAVCLPEKDIEPRQLCIIAGWGVRKPGEMNQTQYLHYLPVPIIDTQDCNSTKHYNGMINEDKICAGFTDSEKSPCHNDEGAPLMCFSDSAGIWELHGILSYHDNCGKGKHPAIYTSLNTKIRQWVVNTIGQTPMRSA